MKHFSKVTALLLSMLILLNSVPAFAAEEAADTEPSAPVSGQEDNPEGEETEDPDAAFYGTGLPRYQCPDPTNPYYFSDLNPFYATGIYGMPNCTTYAWGRAYEYYGELPLLSTYNAGVWFHNNVDWQCYEFGTEARVGAIACWDSWDQGAGHVAFVEAIDGNYMTLSESNWEGVIFDMFTLRKDSSLYTKYRFLGFIYPDQPYEGKSKLPGEQWTVYTAVDLKTGPGLQYETKRRINPGCRLSITEMREADGFLWGKCTYNTKDYWIILNACSCDSNPSLTPPPITKELSDPEERVVISTPGVNLRVGPGLKHGIVMMVPTGTHLTARSVTYAKDYNWAEVVYEGRTYYCVYDYTELYSEPEPITPSEPVTPSEPDKPSEPNKPSEPDSAPDMENTSPDTEPDQKTEKRIVHAIGGLNLRSGIGTNHPIVGGISNEAEITIFEVVESTDYIWCRTKYNGVEGWCVYTYTEALPENVKPSQPQQPAEDVKPSQPQQPAEDVKPSQPQQPAEEVKPSQPQQPAEDVKPSQPQQPAEDVKPSQPQQPAEDAKPSQPQQPTNTTETNQTPAKEYRKVNTTAGLNVRAGAGTNYKIVTALENNTEFEVLDTVIGTDYTWLKISVNGITGWCVKTYTAEVMKTETSKPTEPSKPTENPQPSEPSKPAETPQPSEPTKPAETAQPSEPSKPTETPQPSEPSKPADPPKPADPFEALLSVPSTYRTTIRTGSQNTDVLALETALNALGYRCGTIDNIFDNATAQAVMAFQTKQKEIVDGWVGQQSWTALYKAARAAQSAASAGTSENSGTNNNAHAAPESSNNPAPKVDIKSLPDLYWGKSRMNKDDVIFLQNTLKAKGYDPTYIDGDFGRMTYLQVAAFQKDHGLIVDGLVGQQTWKALLN